MSAIGWERRELPRLELAGGALFDAPKHKPPLARPGTCRRELYTAAVRVLIRNAVVVSILVVSGSQRRVNVSMYMCGSSFLPAGATCAVLWATAGLCAMIRSSFC